MRFLFGVAPLSSRCKAPILNRFRDVRALHVLRASQIRHGARDFENAVIGARGKIEAADGLLEQIFACRIGSAVAVDFFRA